MSVQTPLRILLSGQRTFGLETLDLLQELGHEIVGVVAPREGRSGQPDRLWAQADVRGLPLLPSNELNAETMPEGVDLIICAHSHAFIGRRTREKAALGAIGYHPSLLPVHRGRDAVKWTIKMRDRIAGGTVFWLNDVVDGGPIAAQDFCFVYPEDTATSLWRRELLPMGLGLFARVLRQLDRGIFVRIPQDPDLATWEPALDPPRLSRPDLFQLGDGSAKFSNIRFVVERGSRELKGLGGLSAGASVRALLDRPEF